MKPTQAQHFVPVAHLARFSASPSTVPLRKRTVHLYDKRSGSFRSAKAEKAGFENDLYTTRSPDFGSIDPAPDQILRMVLDPANKDVDIEMWKAEIEEKGLAAIRVIESWDIGSREVSDDERVPLLAYAGLLLAQHPTMMDARRETINERFWSASGRDRDAAPPELRAVIDEMARNFGVIALIPDAFAAAHELNYLGWKVVRWRGASGLILGDVGIAAWYPGDPLAVGDLWTVDARFLLPISPTTLVVLTGFAPGSCLVEERSGPNTDAGIGAINCASWARSRSEVYAARRDDLDSTLVALGPLAPQEERSRQLSVRASVLPDFRVDADDVLHFVDPADSDPGEVRSRFDARFNL
jgi:Protein of unknown function (DUF4238)